METPNMTFGLPHLPVVGDKPPDECVAEVLGYKPDLPAADELAESPVIPEKPEPEVPTFDEPTPEVPKFGLPAPELPTFDLPTPELPTLDLPTPEVPKFDKLAPELPTLDTPQPAVPKFDEPEKVLPVIVEKLEPVLEEVSLEEPKPVPLPAIPELPNPISDTKPPVALDKFKKIPLTGIGSTEQDKEFAYDRKSSKHKINVDLSSIGKEYKKSKVATSGISAALKIVRLVFACCIPHASPPPKKMFNSQRPSKTNIHSPTASSLDKTATGKLGDVKEADAEINQLFNAIECNFREKLLEEKPGLAQTDSFTVTQYRTQIVVGMNYFTKIRINDGPDYVHARIYKPVDGKPWLTSILPNQTEQDDIEYF